MYNTSTIIVYAVITSITLVMFGEPVLCVQKSNVIVFITYYFSYFPTKTLTNIFLNIWFT